MSNANASPLRWSIKGLSVYLWDEALDAWRRAELHAEKPCDEALWLYRNLLHTFSDPAFYEWKEGAYRFRIQR